MSSIESSHTHRHHHHSVCDASLVCENTFSVSEWGGAIECTDPQCVNTTTNRPLRLTKHVKDFYLSTEIFYFIRYIVRINDLYRISYNTTIMAVRTPVFNIFYYRVLRYYVVSQFLCISTHKTSTKVIGPVK